MPKKNSERLENIIEAYLSKYAHKPCWSVNKYLGSMLSFYFGKKISETSYKGEPRKVGEFGLSIRFCEWDLFAHDIQINCEDDLSKFNTEISPLFIGSYIKKFEISQKHISIEFSNKYKFVIKIDNADVYDIDDEICVLTEFKNGIYAEVYIKQNLEFECTSIPAM